MNTDNHDASQPVRRRWPRHRTIVLLIGIFMVLLVASPFIWAKVKHHLDKRRRDRIVAELDAKAPGWRLKDIEKNREPIPDEQNSALAILAASQHLPKNWPQDLKPEEEKSCFRDGCIVGHLVGTFGIAPVVPMALPVQALAASAGPESGVRPVTSWDGPSLDLSIGDVPLEVQLNRAQTEYLRYQLQQVAPAVEHMEKLSKMPKGRFPPSGQIDPLTEALEHLTRRMRTQRLLNYNLTLLTQDNDFESAYRVCKSQFYLADCEDTNGTLLSSIGDKLFWQIGINSLERMLAQGLIADEHLYAFRNL